MKKLNNHYENDKWDLINFSTKNMHRYLSESLVNKVIEILDKNISPEEIEDYDWDKRG
tara:strand:+ start:267 stop:440 length:174 start_codon:yes stop_codon:yes gene_type:complete